jgi:glycosyltransferase involved in cell wall biosynthesis
VLLISGGELVDDFAAVAPVTLVKRDPDDEPTWHSLLRRASWGDPLEWPPPASTRPERLVRLAARRTLVRSVRRQIEQSGPPDLIYLNSAASARALSILPERVPLIAHVHEMSWALDWLNQRSPWSAEQLRERPERFIAASGPVRSDLHDVLGVDPAKVVVCHEAVPVSDEPVPASAIAQARDELGIGPEALVVGSVGAVNWRKAPDLFLQLAKQTIARSGGRDVQFVWLGPVSRTDPTAGQVRHDLERAGLGGRVRFVEARADPRPIMAMFDVFVLTSREDPFPLACLEAAVLGKPVLCFDAGGMSEFLEPDERLVMPYLDVEAMSARLMELLGSESERLALGDALARRVRERHTIDATAPRLLELIREATSNV